MVSKEPGGELPFYPSKPQIGSGQIRESWRKINQQLSDVSPGPRKINGGRWTALAAICIFLFMLVYLTIPRYRTVETAYGEMKNVYLPDSTLVVLNSNSRLIYPIRWNDAQRYVRLEGEAFFRVAGKPVSEAKFTVHTKLLDVEVLGTVFNVNAGLAGRTAVSLNEGKILVNTKNELPGGRHVINMIPGEVLIVDEDSYSKTKDQEVSQRSAWINNDFYFDSTPLSEVAMMIERKYGYTVRFEHDSLRSMNLSGNMHAENFIQFEKALEVTMKMDLNLRSDTLFIRQASY